MLYDLNLLVDFCIEFKLNYSKLLNNSIEIELDKENTICIINSENESNSFISFKDSKWHNHNKFLFCDKDGYYVEYNYIDFLYNLADGNVLICTLIKDGELYDRYPIHKDYFAELKYIQPGESLIIHRVNINIQN
jgi:hypothetical protein